MAYETLTEIFANRSTPSPGYNPQRFVELIGAKEVATEFYEPDPETYRDKYYYNTATNQLFLLITATVPTTGKVIKYWKAINEY
jgi:hypothetical protein